MSYKSDELTKELETIINSAEDVQRVINEAIDNLEEIIQKNISEQITIDRSGNITTKNPAYNTAGRQGTQYETILYANIELKQRHVKSDLQIHLQYFKDTSLDQKEVQIALKNKIDPFRFDNPENHNMLELYKKLTNSFNTKLTNELKEIPIIPKNNTSK